MRPTELNRTSQESKKKWVCTRQIENNIPSIPHRFLAIMIMSSIRNCMSELELTLSKLFIKNLSFFPIKSISILLINLLKLFYKNYHTQNHTKSYYSRKTQQNGLTLLTIVISGTIGSTYPLAENIYAIVSEGSTILSPCYAGHVVMSLIYDNDLTQLNSM